MKALASLVLVSILFVGKCTFGQNHPQIYISNAQKGDFKNRIAKSAKIQKFIAETKEELAPYVNKHVSDPNWITSRLQMYWNNKFQKVLVDGMDFSHGEGEAALPTVKFSGSRDWATDYLKPKIEEIIPYMDDEKGMYLQNNIKAGKPWEWVGLHKTGHIIENINRDILKLAEDAAFIYWLTNEENYAAFASDILLTYLNGMYHRDAPQTVGDHKNANLMGLQTFEVIHEGIIEPITVCYDFIYNYLSKNQKDLEMIQSVFQKWADQEIKYGVPDNNWNMMQARFTTYLAIALEDDSAYRNGKGQQYYFDQILYQNSIRQKALTDVMKFFDLETGIWPEVAGYSIMVSDDLLEIISLWDKTLNNNLLAQFPILEKAIMANFNYLAPNGFTVAYGDAKHSRLRFNAFELLASQYRKYGQKDKELLIADLLTNFINQGAYKRDEIGSLFDLFFYVDDLQKSQNGSEANSIVHPTFYSPNVSWLVQRNGDSKENGMMISSNASLGNHSHTNGINMELYAKGMAIAPDAAAGVSYWTDDHKEYYSRFPAHNTVVVDGISDYRNMRGTQAFELKSIFPKAEEKKLYGDFTYSDVEFLEPSTNSKQNRFLATIRTSWNSGYFIDIFRSKREDEKDKKHEYVFHSQGDAVQLYDQNLKVIKTQETAELSSKYGDQVGYDYFKEKKSVKLDKNFMAQFSMPSILGKELKVNLWMKGETDRQLFTAMAPHSRAINKESVPSGLYFKASPTFIVRQNGEAYKKPFVSIIDAIDSQDQVKVSKVDYFNSLSSNPNFLGIKVQSTNGREDFIFNSSNPTEINKNEAGEFKGTIAIVSEGNGEVSSMLLGNGGLIEKGGYKIETKDENAQILLEFKTNGIKVDASQAFILTIPLAESDKLFDLTSNKKIIFKGRVYKEGNIRFIEFGLPMSQSFLTKSY